MQLNIIDVTTCLAENSQAKSVSVISAISDLTRHLRKSMQNTVDMSEKGDAVIKWNIRFQSSIDQCLTQLSKKVSFYDSYSFYYILFLKQHLPIFLQYHCKECIDLLLAYRCMQIEVHHILSNTCYM